MGRKRKKIITRPPKRLAKKFECLKCGQKELALVKEPAIGPRKAVTLGVAPKPITWALQCNECDEYFPVKKNVPGKVKVGTTTVTHHTKKGKLVSKEVPLMSPTEFGAIDAYAEYIDTMTGIYKPKGIARTYTAKPLDIFRPGRALKTKSQRKLMREIRRKEEAFRIKRWEEAKPTLSTELAGSTYGEEMAKKKGTKKKGRGKGKTKPAPVTKPTTPKTVSKAPSVSDFEKF